VNRYKIAEVWPEACQADGCELAVTHAVVDRHARPQKPVFKGCAFHCGQSRDWKEEQHQRKVMGFDD
jgi:hypothetical protein